MPRTTPKPLPQLTDKDKARFWRKVEKRGPDECWPWKAAHLPTGYGLFHFGQDRTVVATRVSFFLATGEDPVGFQVQHACDNPPCVNPAHLKKGTPWDNTLDMWDRNREAPGIKGARLAGEDLELTREAWRSFFGPQLG